MAKKTFKTPTETTERKGLNLLISDDTDISHKIDKKNYYAQSDYITSNVRVRKDLREKIYTLKGRTGKNIVEIYTMIFEEYFRNNPL